MVDIHVDWCHVLQTLLGLYTLSRFIWIPCCFFSFCSVRQKQLSLQAMFLSPLSSKAFTGLSYALFKLLSNLFRFTCCLSLSWFLSQTQVYICIYTWDKCKEPKILWVFGVGWYFASWATFFAGQKANSVEYKLPHNRDPHHPIFGASWWHVHIFKLNISPVSKKKYGGDRRVRSVCICFPIWDMLYNRLMLFSIFNNGLVRWVHPQSVTAMWKHFFNTISKT